MYLTDEKFKQLAGDGEKAGSFNSETIVWEEMSVRHAIINAIDDQPKIQVETDVSLRPCPFCGGEGYLDNAFRNIKAERLQYMVVCKSCTAEGGWAKTEGNAKRNWNMRHQGNLKAN